MKVVCPPLIKENLEIVILLLKKNISSQTTTIPLFLYQNFSDSFFIDSSIFLSIFLFLMESILLLFDSKISSLLKISLIEFVQIA